VVLPNPDVTQGNKIAVNQKTTAARVHKVMDLVGMTVRQNVMTGDIECRFGELIFKEKDSEKAIEAFMHACVRCGMSAAARIIKIVLLRAVENRYSPVAEWIKSKPWDGRSRMQELCETLIMRAPAHNMWRDIVVRLWCKQVIAAVRNWELDSPTEIGQVLVLQGTIQGEHKSKWIKALMPAPFVMTGATLRLDHHNERDVVSRVTETAITELGELDASFSKSATGALKNFITSPIDKYRPPYGTKPVSKARGTAFAATLNPGGFLVDPSGARRYWPVAVVECLVEHGIDMQQLWAEVWRMHEANPVFWLNDEEKLMHAAITEGHKAPTDVNYILDDLKYRAGLYNPDKYVHANARELWSWYLKVGRQYNTNAYSDLNTGLEAAGFRGARVRGKEGYWVPPYGNTITKEVEDELKRQRWPVIKGGKGDD
jgi:Virulence-associated protein E